MTIYDLIRVLLDDEGQQMKGVNTIVVYRETDGTYWITQANGFTVDRGMFVQLYDREGNKV